LNNSSIICVCIWNTNHMREEIKIITGSHRKSVAFCHRKLTYSRIRSRSFSLFDGLSRFFSVRSLLTFYDETSGYSGSEFFSACMKKLLNSIIDFLLFCFALIETRGKWRCKCDLKKYYNFDRDRNNEIIAGYRNICRNKWIYQIHDCIQIDTIVTYWYFQFIGAGYFVTWKK
jgi:hypothetical protein